MWLAPLDEFNAETKYQAPEPMNAKNQDAKKSLEFFAVLNRVLKTLPSRPGEAALIAQFDQIGVGPNATFDVDQLSAAQRKGLQRTRDDAEQIIRASTQRTIASFNG